MGNVGNLPSAWKEMKNLNDSSHVPDGVSYLWNFYVAAAGTKTRNPTTAFSGFEFPGGSYAAAQGFSGYRTPVEQQVACSGLKI